MLVQIPALSVSRSVREWLPEQPAPGRVLAVFARSCLLSSEDGRLLSLVLPEIGDGPLNVVVEGGSGAFADVKPGGSAGLSHARLQIEPLVVELAAARTWEPCPAWPALRASWPAALERLGQLRSTALSYAPLGSLFDLQQDGAPGRGTAQQATEVLACGWWGDMDALRQGALQLAGLGGGLTPSGDDFLAGLMIRAWLAHPQPEAFCRAVADVAAPRTTALSAAFLRAAARGECSAAWHELLGALSEGTDSQLTKAVRSVLAHGHTSGVDTLAGFLYGPGTVDCQNGTGG